MLMLMWDKENMELDSVLFILRRNESCCFFEMSVFCILLRLFLNTNDILLQIFDDIILKGTFLQIFSYSLQKHPQY